MNLAWSSWKPVVKQNIDQNNKKSLMVTVSGVQYLLSIQKDLIAPKKVFNSKNVFWWRLGTVYIFSQVYVTLLDRTFCNERREITIKWKRMLGLFAQPAITFVCNMIPQILELPSQILLPTQHMRRPLRLNKTQIFILQ